MRSEPPENGPPLLTLRHYQHLVKSLDEDSVRPLGDAQRALNESVTERIRHLTGRTVSNRLAWESCLVRELTC
jgi:hypothetical protein